MGQNNYNNMGTNSYGNMGQNNMGGNIQGNLGGVSQNLGMTMGQNINHGMNQNMGQNMGQGMGQGMGQAMAGNVTQNMGQSMGQGQGQSQGQGMPGNTSQFMDANVHYNELMNKKSIDTKNENMSDNFNAECYIPETSNNNSVNHTVNFIKKSPNEILTNENNSTKSYSNINNDNCSNNSLNITPPSIIEPTNLGNHEKVNILNETSTVQGTTLTQALSNTQIQTQGQA